MHRRQRVSGMWAHTAFAPLYNLSGCPAGSRPLHMIRKGLPVGIQVGAAFGTEALLFRLSANSKKPIPGGIGAWLAGTSSLPICWRREPVSDRRVLGSDGYPGSRRGQLEQGCEVDVSLPSSDPVENHLVDESGHRQRNVRIATCSRPSSRSLGRRRYVNVGSKSRLTKPVSCNE